ncbi:V-type ATPase [Colletotrichum tofieldiae]|nr:V-type ATPase [Colletotrichum tofieldiae]GKT69683.1 V-type ATPase [Colletotrichum tofieldiae]
MSGIIAVYSLVISVLIAQDLTPPGAGSNYSLFKGYRNYENIIADSWNSGFMHLACGLSVGLTGLAAGYTIGIVGDKGVRSYMEQSRIFVGMVLILIFGEVLGLYGYGASVALCYLSANPYPSLIVALILNTKSKG